MPKALLLFAYAICALATRGAAQADTHLTFCYDPYPPYTLGSDGAPTGGLKVALLKAVFDRMPGLSADVVLMPWKRCQEQARSGAVDGILPLFYSDERAAYLAFSDETFLQSSALWYRADRYPEGAGWSGDYAALGNVRLGMLGGAVIDTAMEAAFAANGPIERVSTVRGLFQMVQFDRVDYVAMDAKVGAYTVAEMGLTGQIVPLPVMIAPRPAFFGLSKSAGADVHLEALNAALADLRASGELARIYEAAW